MSRRSSDGADRCITCADEGIPMRIVAVGETGALCADAGERLHPEIAVELVEPVAVGERILVHAGVAIGRIGDA